MFYQKPKIYKNYIEDWDSNEQIIVCENGVFKRARTSSISYIIKRTSFENLNLDESTIVYDKIGSESITLDEKPHMKKKIPQGIIDVILKFYQVYAQKDLEVKLNVWYDKVKDEFFIDCPFQENSTFAVTEHGFDHPGIIWTDELKDAFPEKLELKMRKKNKEIEKILETHSHHNLSCSFSGQDDLTDYFNSVGYHLIGVYKTVLKYPTLDLRYFISPYSKSRELTGITKDEDEIRFVEEDIIDKDDNTNFSYDFNKFATNVGIGSSKLF